MPVSIVAKQRQSIRVRRFLRRGCRLPRHLLQSVLLCRADAWRSRYVSRRSSYSQARPTHFSSSRRSTTAWRRPASARRPASSTARWRSRPAATTKRGATITWKMWSTSRRATQAPPRTYSSPTLLFRVYIIHYNHSLFSNEYIH